MTPDITGDAMSQIGVYVPTNVKEALFLLAHDKSEPRDDYNMSRLAREYIIKGIQSEDDVPEEVLDLLDEDVLANAGGDEFGKEVEA